MLRIAEVVQDLLRVCCVPGVTCVLQVHCEWAEQKLLLSRSICPWSPTSLLRPRGQTWVPRPECIVALLILSPGLPIGTAALTCRRVKAPAPQGGWICFCPGRLLAQLVSYHLLSHPCRLSSALPSRAAIPSCSLNLIVLSPTAATGPGPRLSGLLGQSSLVLGHCWGRRPSERQIWP